MNILILINPLMDPPNPEEADIQIEADFISKSLTELGHQIAIEQFTINLLEMKARIAKHKPELIFNMVESLDNDGRLILLAPVLLEHLSIPFTGSGLECTLTTSNKTLSKMIMQSRGIPTPRWIGAINHVCTQQYLDGKFIIKPLWEDASIGLDEKSVIEVYDKRELNNAIVTRQSKYGGEWFAEEYIEGREVNVSLLADGKNIQVLPIAEIKFTDYPADKPQIVDYRAKWDKSSFEYKHTARSFQYSSDDQRLLTRLGSIARECWAIFGLRGYARVDLRIDAQGNPWVLEVNANPCISPDAGFIAAAAQAGLSYTNVIERIIHASK